MIRRPHQYTLFPYTTLFRSGGTSSFNNAMGAGVFVFVFLGGVGVFVFLGGTGVSGANGGGDHDLTCSDRKSTRLNSSHSSISYAVFCLKKKSRALYPRSDPC